NRKPAQLVDAIPIHSPEQTVNEYKIKSTIYDLQSRFNLNNLADQKYQKQFLRLMKLVLPDVNHEQASAIVKSTIDWITPVTQQNSLSKYYLDLPDPYRPAHRPMLNASELKLVKGVTP